MFVKERRKCVYLQLRKMLPHLWLFSTIWRNILCSSITFRFVSYTQIENTSVKKPISTFEYFSRFLARGNKLPDSIDEDFSQDFLLFKSWCNEVRKKKIWINERERRSKRSTKSILSSCSWSHRSFQVNYHSISLPLTLKKRIYLSN